jgi:hypothetical protein
VFVMNSLNRGAAKSGFQCTWTDWLEGSPNSSSIFVRPFTLAEGMLATLLRLQYRQGL